MRQIIALLALLSLPITVFAQSSSPRKFLPDDPLPVEPPPVPVIAAKGRKVSDVYDVFLNTFTTPGERQPKEGPSIPALGVNTLGEVMDPAWYVGRHYFRPMTVEELLRGPGNETPPAAGVWTVVAAKDEGITPGFTIRDSTGQLYVMKFDPMSNPEIASAADVITSKILYALGYHVPENYIVHFERSRLAIGSETKLLDRTGHKRKMNDQDLADILFKVPRDAQKNYRAIASRYLVGEAQSTRCRGPRTG